jgi:hypothetical protein
MVGFYVFIIKRIQMFNMKSNALSQRKTAIKKKINMFSNNKKNLLEEKKRKRIRFL